MILNIEIKTTKENIDWQAVAELLSYYGLRSFDADTQRKVFENSYAVAFAYDEDKLIGCGRALSDGICQAALYNIAVDEKYHGKGIGRLIIESILEQIKGCTVTLYTHPRTVALYEKFGFRRLKTGMTLFADPDHTVSYLEEAGFLFPEKIRFNDKEYDS